MNIKIYQILRRVNHFFVTLKINLEFFMTAQNVLKRKAAEKAVEFVKSGMVLGFGTGSTFNHVLYILSEKIKSGELEKIVGIPSSEKTVKLAMN